MRRGAALVSFGLGMLLLWRAFYREEGIVLPWSKGRRSWEKMHSTMSWKSMNRWGCCCEKVLQKWCWTAEETPKDKRLSWPEMEAKCRLPELHTMVGNCRGTVVGNVEQRRLLSSRWRSWKGAAILGWKQRNYRAGHGGEMQRKCRAAVDCCYAGEAIDLVLVYYRVACCGGRKAVVDSGGNAAELQRCQEEELQSCSACSWRRWRRMKLMSLPICWAGTEEQKLLRSSCCRESAEEMQQRERLSCCRE